MRQAVALLLLLALGCTAPRRPAPPPNDSWYLRVCEGSASKGSTCALLDQRLTLEVRYAQAATDVGRVLFTGTISRTSAQMLLAEGTTVIHSFDIASVKTFDPDLPFFRVEVGTGIYSASALLPSADIDNGSSAIRGLRQQLAEMTHAF